MYTAQFDHRINVGEAAIMREWSLLTTGKVHRQKNGCEFA